MLFVFFFFSFVVFKMTKQLPSNGWNGGGKGEPCNPDNVGGYRFLEFFRGRG